MKVAIISDIHGNPGALKKVLESIRKKKCERTICLGDVVGYGYDPSACIDLVRKHCKTSLKGNHDAGLVGELGLDWFSATARDGVLRHRPLVSEEDKAWLRGLSHLTATGFLYQAKEKDEKISVPVAFTHGTMTNPPAFEYVDGMYAAWREFSWMKRCRVRVLFCGHTHCACVHSVVTKALYTSGKRHIQMPKIEEEVVAKRKTVTLDEEKSYIFNVGSVGYPRNQPFSSYAILDTDKATVSFVQVPFDFDGYITNLEKSGIVIPRWMDRCKGEFF